MRAWDGLGVGEMAELLGCSANAVSIRLHRARASLRRALDDLAKDGIPTGQVRGDRRA